MIKAVIFDMDGLILDTEIIEHRSLEKVLNEYGKKPILYPNGLIHRVGSGGLSPYEDLKARYFIDDKVENIQKRKREIFDQIITDEEITAFPGLIEFLEFIKQKGFIIALASNRNQKSVKIILDTLKIKDFFTILVGKDENVRAKPFPDMYIKTAEILKVKPEECVVLEDSEYGVISAEAAGMKVIAIPNIYTHDHNFSKADIVVKSLLDINLDLLESLK